VCALLRTKLTAPTSAGPIARRNLVERLEGSVPGALRVVIAPAGWGKSTVLAQWVHSTRVPVTYLALDRFDDDPARCWLHLLSAISEAARVDVADLIGALRLRMPSLVADIVEPLLERLDERDLLIVLDDFHCVTDATVIESVLALIDLSPSTLSIAVASRSEPPLGLERRRVAGELVELRLKELGMSVSEAAVLLEHSAGRPIDKIHAMALVERTEGWPAGIYLASLALRSAVSDDEVVRRFSGENRQVGDYLSVETLALSGEPDREFLLATAVLGELDAQLCNAVRNACDSARRLPELASDNQFVIPRGSSGGRYRYHQLFQEWLLSELARTGDSAVRDAHRRAARAHAARDEPIPAMYHALAAADWDLAHEFFRRFALSLIGEGLHASVARWCARFPDDIEPGHLIAIKVTQAWEGVVEGDVDAAERYCRLIERLNPSDQPIDEWSGDPGQLAVVRAFCRQLRGQLADAAIEIDTARNLGVAERIELPLNSVAAFTNY